MAGRDECGDVIECAGRRDVKEHLSFANACSMRLKSGLYGGRIGAARRSFDRQAHARLSVDREVVQRHDIADAQARHRDLLDIREKARVVDRAVEDRRRPSPFEVQGADNRVRVPVPEGGVIPETRAAWTAAVASQADRSSHRTRRGTLTGACRAAQLATTCPRKNWSSGITLVAPGSTRLKQRRRWVLCCARTNKGSRTGARWAGTPIS